MKTLISRRRAFLIAALLWGGLTANAQSWTLPKDSSGFSILTPSSDSRIMYVSSSSGNDGTAQIYSTSQVGTDPRDPSISVNAYATIGAAVSQMRDGYPDWVLLQRGDVWTNVGTINLNNIGSGRNSSERLVITWYGDTGDRPQIQQHDTLFYNFQAVRMDNWAIVGIEKYDIAMDPDDSNYTFGTYSGTTTMFTLLSGGTNVLIEDCKMNFSDLVMQGVDGDFENVEIRRNISTRVYFLNSCNQDIRGSNYFLDNVQNFLLEENVADYGGWLEGISTVGRTQYNHGFYIQYSCGGELIHRGNIMSRASGNGGQLRSGAIAEMNLTVESPAGYFVDRDTQSDPAVADNVAVRYNVILDGLWMGNCTPSSGANWGLTVGDQVLAGTDVIENIISGNLDQQGNVRGVYLQSSSNNSGNIVYDFDPNQDMFDSSWPDPDRTLGDYYQSIGGTNSTDDFLDAVCDRAINTWPYNFTAYAVIDYIRAGFGLSAVGPGSGGGTVSVTGVSVSPSTLSLNVSQTAQLSEDVVPSNATNQAVTWSSNNTSVATVNSSGLVTAVGVGTATITVTTVDGSYTDTTAVGVSSGTVSVTGVSLIPTTISLNVSQTAQLTETVSPSNATNQNVTWSSSNTSVATVSSSGLVSAVGVGSATITVTTVDGSYTDTTSVSVSSGGGSSSYLLFEDTFNRSNSSDLTANLPSGQTGSLVGSGGVDWLEAVPNGTSDASISGNSLALAVSDGSSTTRVQPDVSFDGETEFTISFTLDFNGATNFFGLSIGDTDQVLDEGGMGGDTDDSWSIGIVNGGDERIWITTTGYSSEYNGNLLPTVSGAVSIAITISTPSGVGTGNSATITSFMYDGTDYVGALQSASVDTFTWAGNENRIQLEQYGDFSDPNVVIYIDEFSVTTPGGAMAAGYITRDYWTGISGSALSNLTGNGNFPNTPTGSDTLSSFQSVDWADPQVTAFIDDNYGERVYGYIVPPTTGYYTFWVEGDDETELYLSTDDSPSNASLIAYVSTWVYQTSWSQFTSQKSSAIYLVADTEYYVEVIRKEGVGGDHMAVGWAKPGESTSAPSEIIPGSVLSPW